MTIGPGDYDIWNCFNGGNAIAGFGTTTQNPFNTINFDGTIAGRRFWDVVWFGGDDEGTVITNWDPDFEYEGAIGTSAEGHIWKPSIDIPGPNNRAQPRVKLAAIGGGGICENEDGTPTANSTYSPGCFDESVPCGTVAGGGACQCCIDTPDSRPAALEKLLILFLQ